MKHLAPLALIATTALIITGCSGSTETDAAPTETPTEKTAEERQIESQQKRAAEEANQPSEEYVAYLEDLEVHLIPLDDDELIDAGANACGQILLSKGVGSDVVTGDDIQQATLSTMANFINDPDTVYPIVRAAVYNVCPELVEQFDYEAMRSVPFYDDFIDERGAWRDEENAP